MLSRSKMIVEIKKRRSSENANTFRQVKYYETAEAEADRLLKGGKI